MKKVVIIGGSKGIGYALLSKLVDDYQVINLSRTNPANLNDKFEHITFDITKDDLPNLENIAHLVYCPGSINLKPISSLKLEDFKEDMEINLYGAIKAIKAYHRQLSKSENASITLFSTVAVTQGMPFHSSVAAAKGAIEGLTKALAAEFAPKIRVNCIAPTITTTPLAAHILKNEDVINKLKQKHPLKNILDPQDLADMAAYLIGPSGKNITGQILHIDAGLSTLKL